MVYEFRAAPYTVKASAQVVGEVCEALDRTGGLTPERLVDASRDEAAPLHGEFEWDDVVAGERYRAIQARNLISLLVVRPDGVPAEIKPIRAYFAVERGKGYESTIKVCQRPDRLALLLERAKGELKSFADKYRHLDEMADVIGAIDRVIGGE